MTRYRWRCELCTAWGWIGGPVREHTPAVIAAAHAQGEREIEAHYARKHRERS